MALLGKLIGYVVISKSGDVFHDLLRHKQDKLLEIVPDRYHDCEFHEGERGAVGSVVSWHYTLDGERKVTKEIIQSINEEDHTIVCKVIEGDFGDEFYKSFRIKFHVEPKGDGQVGIWTLQFEKQHTSVPYPTSLMDLLCNLIKDLDAHNGDK